MKIYKLTKDNKAHLMDLMPESMIDELGFPGQNAIGIGEEGEDTLSGVISFYIDPMPLGEAVLVIRWIYVLPEDRMKGYGSALFDKICDFAEAKGIREIHCTFPQIEATAAMEHLLYEMHFSNKRKGIVDAYTYIGEVATFAKAPIMKGIAKIVPFSAIGEEQFRSYFMTLDSELAHLEEYLLTWDAALYEKQVSQIAVDAKGEILGVCMWRYLNNALEPVLINMKGPQSAVGVINLFQKALADAKAIYGPDIQIRICSSEDQTWDTYSKIFPNIKSTPSIQGIMFLD